MDINREIGKQGFGNWMWLRMWRLDYYSALIGIVFQNISAR